MTTSTRVGSRSEATSICPAVSAFASLVASAKLTTSSLWTSGAPRKYFLFAVNVSCTPGSLLASTKGPEPIGLCGSKSVGTIEVVGLVSASGKVTVGYFSSKWTVLSSTAVTFAGSTKGSEPAGGSLSANQRLTVATTSSAVTGFPLLQSASCSLTVQSAALSPAVTLLASCGCQEPSVPYSVSVSKTWRART